MTRGKLGESEKVCGKGRSNHAPPLPRAAKQQPQAVEPSPWQQVPGLLSACSHGISVSPDLSDKPCSCPPLSRSFSSVFASLPESACVSTQRHSQDQAGPACLAVCLHLVAPRLFLSPPLLPFPLVSLPPLPSFPASSSLCPSLKGTA